MKFWRISGKNSWFIRNKKHYEIRRTKIQQTRMNMVRFFHLREAGIHSYVPMGDLALLQNCVFDEHLRR